MVNGPLPLNTLEGNDTATSDFPYNVLFGPFMITIPSSIVNFSKMAVVIPELWKAFSPMLVTEDGIVMDVKPVML